MINPYHNTEIVVNADRLDWGKRWGVAPRNAEGCWCYSCTMERWPSLEHRVEWLGRVVRAYLEEEEK